MNGRFKLAKEILSHEVKGRGMILGFISLKRHTTCLEKLAEYIVDTVPPASEVAAHIVLREAFLHAIKIHELLNVPIAHSLHVLL